MESSLQGQLSTHPTANLFREIAEKRLSGLLRIVRDEAVRAIFFENGAPAFSASNLPEEQLEHRLMVGSGVSAELIDEAKRRSLTPQGLGFTLVELGAISQQSMQEAIRELTVETILSTFEWDQGDFSFFEDSELNLSPKLEWPAAECILAGARRAARVASIAAIIADPNERVAQSQGGSVDTGGAVSVGSAATLNSIEGFVFSSILAPTAIRDVAALTGLPESEAQSALVVLLALGLLKLEGISDAKPAKVQPAATIAGADRARYGGASVEWVADLVARKLASIESVDLYQVLGVDRFAPAGRIIEAHKELRESFDSLRYRWPEEKELSESLEALFAKIAEAFETLSDPERRSAYDRPPDLPAKRQTPRKTKPAKPGAAAPPVGTAGTIGPPKGVPAPADRQFDLDVGAPTANPTVRSGQVFNAVQMADEHYQRGRTRFDRRDFHSAVHLFRQAVRLDPGQSRYHYHLGLTLSILSQARQEHHAHTHGKGCHVTCVLGSGLVRNQRVRREAEEHMLKAADLDQSNPEIRLRLALLYKDAGMEKKAGHYFLETLALDANNAIALRELGIGSIEV